MTSLFINLSTMIEYLLWVLVVPAVLILYIVYQFLIKIYIDAAKFKKMDPDLKLFVSPFTGLLGLQRQNLAKYGDSLRYVKQMVRENPDQKAYLTNLGHLPMLILCDAQLIKEYLLNPKKYKKLNLYKHNDKAYSKGLFLAEDDEWTRQKTIVRHSFNHENMKRMIPAMMKSIEGFNQRLIQTIQSTAQKSVDFKVLHDAETLIGQILVKIFFSEQAVNKKLRGKALSIALAESTVAVFDRSRSGENLFWFLFFGEKVATMNFSKKDSDYEAYLMEIRKCLNQILQARLTGAENPEKERDFIQVYVDQMRENERLINQAQAKGQSHNIKLITQQEVLQQLLSFYFAGIDTTGHLVAFALYCLAEYPECRTKIINEIKTVIQTKDGINYENLSKLDYMNIFLDEVLRMWPPATGNLARVAKEDVKLGPYSIPKGTIMGSNLLGLMMNPKYYDNPEVFNPERWNQPGAYSKQPYSFVPFSAGPRSCIGKYLALMQTKLIIINFLNVFDFQRTQVPLRVMVKFLYEPAQEDLVRLKIGGIQLK